MGRFGLYNMIHNSTFYFFGTIYMAIHKEMYAILVEGLVETTLFFSWLEKGQSSIYSISFIFTLRSTIYNDNKLLKVILLNIITIWLARFAPKTKLKWPYIFKVKECLFQNELYPTYIIKLLGRLTFSCVYQIWTLFPAIYIYSDNISHSRGTSCSIRGCPCTPVTNNTW